jgi:hypothetical protein
MAQKVHVTLQDDIDGGKAVETVRFALDGMTYEIDLSAKNARQLRSAFKVYTESARRTPRTGTKAKRAGGTKKASPRNAEIRNWARSQGHEISERGRIPADIAEAFETAHAA